MNTPESSAAPFDIGEDFDKLLKEYVLAECRLDHAALHGSVSEMIAFKVESTKAALRSYVASLEADRLIVEALSGPNTWLVTRSDGAACVTARTAPNAQLTCDGKDVRSAMGKILKQTSSAGGRAGSDD